MHPSLFRSLPRYRTLAPSLASTLRCSSSPPAARYYTPARRPPVQTSWENGAAFFGLVGLFLGSWVALREEAAAEEIHCPPRKLRTIRVDELKRHRAGGGEGEGKWWVAIEGKVYDVGSYASSNAVVPSEIAHHPGEDITELFRKVQKQEGMLQRPEERGAGEVGRLEGEVREVMGAEKR